MTDFISFATSLGLNISSIEYGKWVRTSTEAHPRKRNGSYFHYGDFAVVQNWETMSDAAVWKSKEALSSKPDHESIRRAQKIRIEAAKERLEKAAKAAKRAGWILSQCELSQHAYLDSKGFPDATGNVWVREGESPLLVIPMRIDGMVVGCQLIDIHGGKKFMHGQKANGAEFVFDNKGIDVWCEGYATALSIRECLKAMRIRYKLHVCFSAGNLQHMAKSGVVVADNDASGTGEAAAKATGLPYYMPPTVGHDFNDHHREVGLTNAMFDLQPLVR